jgi:hypothetical protein
MRRVKPWVKDVYGKPGPTSANFPLARKEFCPDHLRARLFRDWTSSQRTLRYPMIPDIKQLDLHPHEIMAHLDTTR